MWDLGRTFCYQHRLVLEVLKIRLTFGEAMLVRRCCRMSCGSFTASPNAFQHRSISSDMESQPWFRSSTHNCWSR